MKKRRKGWGDSRRKKWFKSGEMLKPRKTPEYLTDEQREALARIWGKHPSEVRSTITRQDAEVVIQAHNV